MTRAEALRAAVAVLGRAGVARPQSDARILLCAAAGIDRVALLRDPDVGLDAAADGTFRSFLMRRAAREPVSRILARREFWGLDLAVTPAVLDPRPDTETLVSAALARIGAQRERPWRILDLGTGSGAILCALLAELPDASGVAVDSSAAACSVARDNLAAHGFGGRSLVVQACWGVACGPQCFDIVVSNPPYIETAAIATLDPDVRDHDPLAALDGGADGLDAYRTIAADLPRLLAAGGLAVLEVGAGQAPSVGTLLSAAGLTLDGTWQDLAGIERVIAGRAPEEEPRHITPAADIPPRSAPGSATSRRGLDPPSRRATPPPPGSPAARRR